MRLSRFTHIFETGADYAYYNSLFLKPVWLSASEHWRFEEGNVDDKLMNTLIANKIIVADSNDDAQLLVEAKEQLFLPYPTIMYLILSEKCNLACKYCFLGNSARDIVRHQMPKMTRHTAEKALQYFIYQLNLKPEWSTQHKEIIFYGGEPLLNFEVMKYVIERCRELQSEGLLDRRLNYSVITNGVLLTPEVTDFLKEHDVTVSISIDGVDRQSNSSRIDKRGEPIFDRLIQKLSMVREKNFKVGLSITLTEETIASVDKIIALADEYGINDISFNILYSAPNYSVKEDYYRRAANFIIEFYKKARQLGIYEDRIMRKINAFVEGRLYLSDCAATSGSQIVVLPDGRIGLCQGCVKSKDYFFTDIDDRTPLETNEVMLEWSRLSPINKAECLTCEALGICGGGCPINARKNSSDGAINAVDKNFCVHARSTLRFMIEDLHSILTTGEPLK